MIFVSNEQNYKTALIKNKFDEIFIDRFAGNFGHCNEKGYGLIAKNVADTIIRDFF